MTGRLSRRTFLQAAAAATAASAFVSFGSAKAQSLTPVRIQFDWLLGNGQMGDIVAQQKGFFAQEGLEVVFGPGGPNAQTVPPVLAGQALMGQLSSTSQFFTAVGAGRPLKLFASGLRSSPYVYISLPDNPIRTPEDLVGKSVAVNPNGRFLLDLIMAQAGLDASTVSVVTMGADMTPLLTGQVDAVSGFLTNTKALSVLGPDFVTLVLSDYVPNYANAYFTAEDSFESQKENLAKVIRAVSRGWGWAFENRSEAVDIMCDAYPALDREIEHQTVDLILSLCFDETTKQHGWGWHDPEKLEKQVAFFEQAKQFEGPPPVVDNCVTWEILDMTADVRPKLG